MLCTRSFAAAQDDKSGYVRDDKSGCVQDDRTDVNQKVRHREIPSEIAAETFRSISSGVL